MAADRRSFDVDGAYLLVIDSVNEEFGERESALFKAKQLHSELTAKKVEIETKLSIVSDEVPTRLSKALTDVGNIMERMDELKTVEEQLNNQVKLHLARVEPVVEDLKQPIHEIRCTENYIRYLQWIQKVHDLSSEIQTALLVKAESRAVACYTNLLQVYKTLATSKCAHLVSFLRVTVQYWYKLLKEKFSKELEDILKLLNWPVLPPTTIDSLQTPDAEVYNQLEVVFKLLLRLESPDEATPGSNANIASTPTLLPLQILLRPLKKRFLFHFYGHKETNNLEKPEWYFTQVLAWIRNHSTFLEKHIQPILDADDVKYVNCKVDFMHGLIALVVEKLRASVEAMLYDDYLLSHTIDETLLFEREVRALGYLPGYATCLSVLTQDQCFIRWINMERKSAVEKMDTIMVSPTAWTLRFQDHGDIDELQVPECGESFMMLILTITDRYKSLPQPGHRLQFLDLQLELLDDFRVRLQQLHKEEAREPLESNYCPILNTVHYIIHVLSEWSELPFFLQMQYYMLQYETTQALLQTQRSSQVLATQMALDNLLATGKEMADELLLGEEPSEAAARTISSSAVQKEALDSLQEDFNEDKLDAMTGTVFDKVVGLLEHMKDEMIRKLADFIVSEVKAKSRPYRTEKWFSMPSHKAYTHLTVSATACPMLMVLKANLHSIQESLAQPLFDRLWQIVAEELNYFFYKVMILRSHFNDGGCVQLHFDITRNFFPIFGDYTRRPENYFKEVKEACLLLVLPTAPALLLCDALKPENARSSHANLDPALAELGVYKLTPSEALNVLNLRTDLSSI